MQKRGSNRDVRFEYTVRPHGWARATLEIDGAQVSLLASYMTDALGDLVRATVAIAAGSPEQQVVWVEEPGCNSWVLTRDRETLRVRVLHYKGFSPTHLGDLGVRRLDASCSAADFIGGIYSGAQAVLSGHGADGYKDLWRRHDFPAADLGTLSTYVVTNDG